MANENDKPAATKSQLPTTLVERFAVPLFWVAVGYGLGFFHGNTSGKRKSGSGS